jgi:uncharacterized protein YjiS (DUF1127 family)|tara:strand:+ start:662 stop:925 length:264 start_codon:yes stop_codon:yes gene_type:complete
MTSAILTVSTVIQDAIEGLMDLVGEWKRKRADKAVIRRTYKELSNLTDHELRDLGIGRSDITSIALGNFHDKRMNDTTTNKNLRGWV